MPDLDPVVATWYDQSCKAAYAGAALLRRTVRTETGITGGTAEFPRVTRAMAKPHVPATPRSALGVAFQKQVCTLTAWDATEYVDTLDATRIRFDQRPVLSTVIGQAMGRREDQLLIDPMVAAFGAATIADGGAGMSDAKLRQIVRLFDQRAVPRENRFVIVSAKVYDDIRSLPIAQNKDFGESAVGRSGVLPSVYGLQIVLIDDARPEGGLPLSGGIRQCFAYDRDAVGLAIAREEPLRTEWVPHLAAWQLSMRARLGGVVIDPEGIIRVDCTEA
jgi:hypothetical protein